MTVCSVLLFFVSCNLVSHCWYHQWLSPAPPGPVSRAAPVSHCTLHRRSGRKPRLHEIQGACCLAHPFFVCRWDNLSLLCSPFSSFSPLCSPFLPSLSPLLQPSLLALAVLGCDLKLLGCDWLSAIVTLQRLAGVRGGELSVCYETVAPFYNVVAMHHPLYFSSMRPPAVPAVAPGQEKAVGGVEGGEVAAVPIGVGTVEELGKTGKFRRLFWQARKKGRWKREPKGVLDASDFT